MQPRVYAAVFAALLGLAAVTSALSGYFHDAKEARAASLFERGRAAVATGRAGAGIEDLRAARELDRGNPRYSLLLATALYEADRPLEAESYLELAMRADPTSGPANLLRARIARALGQPGADAWYERAMTGAWPEPDDDARLDAGIELAGYLLGIDDAPRARAVLVRLAVDADDPPRAKQVASLLLAAGGPDDAARVARALTTAQPHDDEAWRLLADAEFAAGRDAEAAAAARRALAIDRSNARAQVIAQVASAVVALDPSARRLTAAERLRRARELLRRIIDAYDACVPEAERMEGDPLAAARRVVARRTRETVDVDAVIELAIAAWTARAARCGPPTADLAAIARLLSRFEAAGARP
ncbi:MAG: tetratricopeptide repeat protein [Acidobacteriota bacterium]